MFVSSQTIILLLYLTRTKLMTLLVTNIVVVTFEAINWCKSALANCNNRGRCALYCVIKVWAGLYAVYCRPVVHWPLRKYYLGLTCLSVGIILVDNMTGKNIIIELYQ